MREIEKSVSTNGMINAYQKFGLRENDTYQWVSNLVELGENFFPWNPNHPLGKNMVPSARVWFTHSELIEPQTKKPTLLVEIFRKYGGTSSIGWEFVWVNLIHNAPLLKWFATDTSPNESYSVEELTLKLQNYYPTLSKVAIDGGVSSLKDLLSKSPLAKAVCQGETERTPSKDASIAFVETKGKIIKQITRRSNEINVLTLLYHFYLIARITNRSVFTIRDMISIDKDGEFVTPASAFGLSAETIRLYCESLHSRYPSYITTTFTHGNDEFEIFPQNHNLNDVINLVLTED